jgi:hypothetical protein
MFGKEAGSLGAATPADTLGNASRKFCNTLIEAEKQALHLGEPPVCHHNPVAWLSGDPASRVRVVPVCAIRRPRRRSRRRRRVARANTRQAESSDGGNYDPERERLDRTLKRAARLPRPLPEWVEPAGDTRH